MTTTNWIPLSPPEGVEGSITYYRREPGLAWPNLFYVGEGERIPGRQVANDFDMSDSELDKLVDLRLGQRRLESLASQGYFWISPGYMG